MKLVKGTLDKTATTVTTPAKSIVTEIRKAGKLAIITRSRIKNAVLIDPKTGLYQRTKDGVAIEPNGTNKPFYVIIQSKEFKQGAGLGDTKTISALNMFGSTDIANDFFELFDDIAKVCKIHVAKQFQPFYIGQKPVMFVNKEGDLVEHLIESYESTNEDGEVIINAIAPTPYYRQSIFAPLSYVAAQLSDFEEIADEDAQF